MLSYTVPASGADNDGISWNANALRTVGNTTAKLTGNDVAAKLGHDAAGPFADHTVGNPAGPAIESITLNGYANEDGSENYVPINGYLTGTGEYTDVYIYVIFDNDVDADGTPTFDFELGGETRTAEWLYAEGRNAEFSYALQADDPDDLVLQSRLPLIG